MRELLQAELSAVNGGDDITCEQVAGATTTVVGGTVAYYGAPATYGGTLLLGLGSMVIYNSTETLCEYYSEALDLTSYTAGFAPLPNWAMFEVPWYTNGDTE